MELHATGQWTLHPMGGWAAGIACLWIVATVLSWLTWRRRPGWKTGLMEGLRWVTVTLILVTLAGPERVRRVERSTLPEIVVLHDASGSMATRDIGLAGAEAGGLGTRRAWVEGALATNFWERWEPRARVIVEGMATADTPAAGSDLNAALQAVLDRHEDLKAVLVLSDGDWNQGESPMKASEEYRTRGVPVFGVTVGRTEALPDLEMERTTVPSYGLLGEQIAIPVRLRNHLARDVRTVVSLLDSSGQQLSKELAVAAKSQEETTLVWLPRRAGEYTVTLAVPVEAEEVDANNNEQTLRIAVRAGQIRVLVIDSAPRWEYRYLRNALERDPGVAVECLLYHPGMGMGEGTNYLREFPASREELSRYDVVFVGDVGLAPELTREQAGMIRGLVAEQASGLVFMPGLRGRQDELLDTDLEELMPVAMNRAEANGLGLSAPTRLELTSRGERHFLTMLATEERRNATVWKGLPGFYWSASVARAKPGSDVLAVHPGRRVEQGRMPLLATRPFGAGEVLFMGTDGAWRWRRGVEDRYHYRFWGQVVRWMAHKRHLASGEGLRLSYTPEVPRLGERVYFQATLRDLETHGASDRPGLEAVVEAPSGAQERLTLRTKAGGWGVSESSFVPEEAGRHALRIQGEGGRLNVRAELDVLPAPAERVGAPAHPDLWRDVAAMTGGASGGIEAWDDLLRRIDLLPEAEAIEVRFRLWCHPAWGGLILILLAIYWTARKAAGMV